MPHPYASPGYAAVLSDAGRPETVAAWDSFVLARPIDGGGEDALGAYPMAAVDPGADLAEGLERLKALGMVSAVLVPDPLFGPPAQAFAAAFPLCRPFKTHYLVDRRDGLAYAPNKHHRHEIRRAGRACLVEQIALWKHIGWWNRFYGALVDKHAVTGPARFSPEAFERLARAPAFISFGAWADGDLAAIAIWFEYAGVAYNHLGASGAAGYAAGASYALYDAAIAHFDKAQVINLGGGAGLGEDPSDGLARFKRGFANNTVDALLCGAVLDEARYAALSGGRTTGFFPAYRG